jgi:hypothetical protein
MATHSMGEQIGNGKARIHATVTASQLASVRQMHDEHGVLLRRVQAAMNEDAQPVHDHFNGALTRELVQALPPVEWLVDGWLPAVGLSGVYGPPGIGKKLFLLYVEDCVLRGRPLFSHPVQRGATMFYAGEGVEHFPARWRAMDHTHLKDDDAEPAPNLYLPNATVDLAYPPDVAAVLKTKAEHERDHGVPVRLVVIDPLAEYMTGDENGEDMDRASRGARAIATIGRCAVVIGHHTNASGERERGSEKPRARAEAWLRMEQAGADRVALIAQKQRGGPPLAMEMEKVPSADGVALWPLGAWDRDTYLATVEDRRAAAKGRRQSERQQKATAEADEAALAFVAANPGITKNKAGELAVGTPVGKDRLKAAMDRLIADGRLRVEFGPNSSKMHYVVEEEQ